MSWKNLNCQHICLFRVFIFLPWPIVWESVTCTLMNHTMFRGWHSQTSCPTNMDPPPLTPHPKNHWSATPNCLSASWVQFLKEWLASGTLRNFCTCERFWPVSTRKSTLRKSISTGLRNWSHSALSHSSDEWARTPISVKGHNRKIGENQKWKFSFFHRK